MGTAIPGSAVRWDRRATLALVLLASAAAASLAWSVHPWYEAGDDTHDASIYIALARSILAGDGYAYLGEPFTARPPGWAALIAALLAWRGLDFGLLNLVTSLFGVASVALLFVHARARAGTPIAAALSAFLWLDADFQRFCNQVMSDVPGVALLLACLALERWSAARPSLARDLALGVCIGACSYVRSIVILLVPAILVARGLAYALDRDAPPRARRGRFLVARILPLAAAAFLVQLPWDVRNAFRHPEPPVDQNFLYSYSTAMWHVDGGDPSSPRRPLGDIAARIPGRALQVTALLGSGMGTTEGAGWSALGAVLLGLTAWNAWRRRAAAEIWALGATFVLLVYFGFRERLVLPIYVVVIAAAADAARTILARLAGERVSALLPAAVLALLALLSFHPRRDWEAIGERHAAFAATCAALNAHLRPDERVAAHIGWHYAVFLDRPVYSFSFAARRSGERGVLDVFRKYAIDAVLFSAQMPGEHALIPTFRTLYGEPERAGDALVFRVRP